MDDRECWQKTQTGIFFLPFPGGNVENKTILSLILEFINFRGLHSSSRGWEWGAWEGSIVGKVIYNQDRLLFFISPLPTRKTKNLSQGVLKQTDPPLVLGMRNWSRLIRRPTERKIYGDNFKYSSNSGLLMSDDLKLFFEWQNIPDIKGAVLTNFRCTSQWYYYINYSHE